jgi:hypothetical protein
VNMIEPKNAQALSQQDQRALSIPASNSEAAQGFTAERVLRTRPKTYRAIVRLLADPHASVNQIAKVQRVSTHTVRAIRTREAKSIAERKQSLISIFGSVAEMSAERMEELCGKASLRDAGIATDKMLALLGETPSALSVEVTLGDKEKVAAIHARLVAQLTGSEDPRLA